MTIYLYVKTHNKTGLKYLGKTISEDPHKYPGSGIRWKKHLKKHGYDYSTEILRECQTENEMIEWGLYYSNLWNVKESNEWANLKEEAGDRGSLSIDLKSRISKSMIGQKHSELRRQNNSIAQKGKKWWHNGSKKTMAWTWPGPGWYEGRGENPSQSTRSKQSASRIGKKWWNNSIKSTLAHSCPGPNWVLGRIIDK